MDFTLKVWKQPNRDSRGQFVTYDAKDIPPEASFLEMLDIVNERLQIENTEPIHFDSDCREGICGSCGLTINGEPHGPSHPTTTCQVRVSHFDDGSTITIEPFRARAFPVLKDLVVDRSAFDRVIQAAGFVSVGTGSAVDANSIPIPKSEADAAFDAAKCIGCGACVGACPNASAMLFVGAKVAHLSRLPQGRSEHDRRALLMVDTMDDEGFGNCTNHYECEAVCPAGIQRDVISTLNRQYNAAALKRTLGLVAA